MLVERQEWVGIVRGRRVAEAEVSLKAPLQSGSRGGSGAFLGLAEDDRRYWIKPLNNLQGPRVPITEQIVGRAGALIGAPTCTVRTIAISPDFTGWEFRPGHRLEAGIAHASLLVEPVVETGTLERRLEDDNALRHAYIIALHDWCWGGDGQWLMAIDDENRYFSHDHGWYLPPEGPGWDTGSLEREVDTPHELPASRDGFTSGVVEAVASSLRAVRRDQLATVLSRIPAAWAVSDDELECVGYFLECRAEASAARLVARFGGVR